MHVAILSHQDGGLNEAQYEEHLKIVAAEPLGEPRAAGLAAWNLALLTAGRVTTARPNAGTASSWRLAIPRAPGPALNLGSLLLRQGRGDEAEDMLRQALASPDPEAAAKAAYNLGTVLADRGEVDEGMRLLQLAVASNDPDESPAALLKLGVLRVHRGEVNQARRDFEKVVGSRHPEYAPQAVAWLSRPGTWLPR